MKKILFSFAVCAMSMSLAAQVDNTETPSDSTEGFRFTTIDSIAITPVKDQNRSSTCWSYSTIGFLESELLRMGKGEYDLSEMFVVHHTMLDRAEYSVRMYGTAEFAPGGSAYDVIYCLKNYGMVPQEVMPGIQYGSTPADTLPVHAELDAIAGGVVKAVTNSGLKKLTPVWKKALTAVYDTYLGECPETFTYNGKEYTPKSFAEELGLNADDYVSITSYTHHPYYTTFALEVPDNWRMDQMYNVPMEEMMAIIDNALAKGYTLAWGADVSEICFTRKGLGVVPEEEKAVDLTGSDAARWLGLSATDKREELTKKPLPEKVITQEMRQAAYDSWENTDDHGMQIFGTAKDQNGKRYYMVKNSWGTKRSEYKGIWYVSEAYMQYKTNDVLVHKNAIPKEIRKKLGI
ncbi:MAG: aminopeptidase [Paludibacteraceae bacterium]|nr:aminopeptidase [Paludibacteraceae bacterium]